MRSETIMSLVVLCCFLVIFANCVTAAELKTHQLGFAQFECFSCYSRSSACGSRMNAESMAVASKQRCRSKCFLRIDGPTVYRDCFDGWIGGMVDSSYNGCRTQFLQGRSMEWCFCEGHLCNGATREDLAKIFRQVEAPFNIFTQETTKSQPEVPDTIEYGSKSQEREGKYSDDREQDGDGLPKRGSKTNEYNTVSKAVESAAQAPEKTIQKVVGEEEERSDDEPQADFPNSFDQLSRYVATPRAIPEIKNDRESASHLIEDGEFVEEGYNDGVPFSVDISDRNNRPSFQPVEVSYSEGISCYECTSGSQSCGERVYEGGFLSKTACRTKCYTRSENGNIFRGCFDGWIGSVVHSDYIGCQKQSYRSTDVTWCFCGTDLCNGQSIEQLGRRLNPTYIGINTEHRHGYIGKDRISYQEGSREFNHQKNIEPSYNRRLYGVDPIPMYAKPTKTEVNPLNEDSKFIRLRSACYGKADGPHSDPLDCSAFIHCSHGVGYKKYCPPGTAWDNRLKHCNFSRRVSPPCEAPYQ
ncbi:uncharacterized protein LOC106166306 [Lingula anatina]|uniref:Uncharacterized protein LOC106166306 n=1 Tax=Lingula anatina TaxID=7574 RepID=A0A1S3IQE2_LINAN|nr:uncharacterized protein LOC106166306 [Lingula anatina]|eukprot:XP_013400288.1 uncharacterized protein LOC106166306 [Lingula anatina]